jgi:hypothetical protein
VPPPVAPPHLVAPGSAWGGFWGVLPPPRARGLKVRAACPFVAAYLRRHPEYDDVRA